MNVGVLTSSRADFGIYLPLLTELTSQSDIELTIIAFGTHLSTFHGKTINEIREQGFQQIDLVSSILLSDDKESIAKSFGLTVISFANYWAQKQYDVVLCLGDRYEMCAAIQAGIPFGVKFAHLHGGEMTTGAIDNIYRDQISLASTLHFTSLEAYSERLKNVLIKSEHIHTVGSLSLSYIDKWTPQFSKSEFLDKYGIAADSFTLITFHPETVYTEKTAKHVHELRKVLCELSKDHTLVITMPNNDTFGSMYTEMYQSMKAENNQHIFLIESFGKHGYFHALNYSDLVLGNSSSGILEAASFGKYVVNVGRRQDGRISGPNVINCDFNAGTMIDAVKHANSLGKYEAENIYFRKNSVSTVINVLRKYHESVS